MRLAAGDPLTSMSTLACALTQADLVVMSAMTGETVSFEATFAKEEHRLYGIAFSILRNTSDAEDAVQDVAAQAWRDWAQRRELDKTQAWLTTLCVRHCIRRRRGLVRSRLLTEAVRQERAATTAHLQYDGRYIDLDRAYRRLSRQQRAVVFLHYHHGFTVLECAQLMGCSNGAASSHLSRALAKLRTEFGND